MLYISQFLLEIIFLIALIKLLMYKNIDISFWLLLFFTIYWYPALSEYIAYGHTTIESYISYNLKIHVFILFFILLLFNYFFENYIKIKLKLLKENKLSIKKVENKLENRILFINTFSVCVCIILLIPLFPKAMTGDKVLIMEDMGYMFKIFELLSILLIARCASNSNKWTLLVCGIAIIVDLFLGMRFVATIGLVAFFIALSVNINNLNVSRFLNPKKIKLYIMFGLLFSILFKLFFPYIVSFDLPGIINIITDYDRIILEINNNSESKSNVIIFNEIINSDFALDFSYLILPIFSIIPLINIIEIPSFTAAFKGSGILPPESESFASNNYALAYSIVGDIGPLILLILFLIFIFFTSKLLLINFPLREKLIPLVSASLATLIIYFTRCELPYFISLVRGIFILEIALIFISRINFSK